MRTSAGLEPTIGATSVSASVQALRDRALLNQRIRAFFADRGFLEVETPAIAHSPGLELHLDAVEVRLREGMAGAPVQRWLVTSPEYHCKRLLAAGCETIYRLGKAFRSGERSAHHNPEFTMLEWYRAGATVDVIAADTLALIAECDRGDRRLQPPVRLGFDALIAEHFAFDCLLTGDDELLAAAKDAGYGALAGETAADLLMRAWVDRVEPNLPNDRAVVVDRYPARLASLAQLSTADPRVAERVEVYVRGVEIANGFTELVDPVEQRERFEADLAARKRAGLPEYPIDERFLTALAACPPAAGIALGVDRLLMVLGGYAHIDDVLAFPFEVV